MKWSRSIHALLAASGRKTSVTDGRGNVTSYSYDERGNLVSETDATGATTAYAYDALNRRTAVMQNAECTMQNGGDGNPVNPVNPVEVNYSYDTLGRFSGVGFNAEAQRGRGDFEYSYLPGTYLVSGYTAGGFTRSVAYEPSRNLIAAITNSFSPARETFHFPLSTFHFQNDSLGRRTAITRGGEAFGDLAGATDAYGYNLRSEVVSSRRTLDGAEVRGFDYDYAYDPIGNRTSATDYDEQGNPLVSSYTANALNQYTSRTVPGYATLRGEAATNATITVNERPTFRQGAYFYGGDMADNAASNLWKELEIYAAINPPGTNTPDIVSATTGTVFIARTPETFTYDADGNMTSDGRFHYFWNGENRLVMASNAEVVVTYAYDHRGRMARKEISHRGTEARRIEYLWDDWNIIREIVREGDTIAITDNVWGLDLDGTLQGAGGVGGLLAVVRDDGVFLPTYDANGNVSEYVSTNGEVAAHYDYSPFGEPLVASGPLAATFTHQFSTKPYCSVTGFSEYQKRKYRPEIGRWLSRDPIEPFFVENYDISQIDAVYRGEPFPGELEYSNLNNFVSRYDIIGLSIHYASGGLPIRGIGHNRHESYLIFEVSCPKGYFVGHVETDRKSADKVLKCIAKKMYPTDSRREAKEIINMRNEGGVSNLFAVLNKNCDGGATKIHSSMRTRYASLIWGREDYIDCYTSILRVRYECAKCICGEMKK